MKHYIFILYILITTGCSLSQGERSVSSINISFKEYQDIIQKRQKALNLIEQKLYKEALEFLAPAFELPELKPYVLVNYAYVHANTGNEQLADSLAREAIKRGIQISWIDTTYFSPLFNQRLQKDYNQYRLHYLNSIDSGLLRAVTKMMERDQSYRSQPGYSKEHKDYLKQERIDSANTEKLKEIIEKFGWPGIPELGVEHTRIHIVADHAIEEDLYYFLDVAVEGAKTGEAKWFEAQSIMSMTLFRFKDKHGLNKLRYVTTDGAGNLDTTSSYFQLATLAKLMSRNPYPMKLIATYYDDRELRGREARLKNLQQIKKQLVEMGIRENMVSIDTHMVKMPDDPIGNSQFAFTNIK
ncbi:MAG: hypothetical protein WBB45_21045 [Cyclobacteriaceae bacterium]